MDDVWTVIYNASAPLERAMLRGTCKYFAQHKLRDERPRSTLSLTIVNRHLDLVWYCLHEGYKPKDNICETTAKLGSIELLDELIGRGYSITHRVLTEATKSQNVDFVKQLVGRDFPYSEETLWAAAAQPSLDVFNYLFTTLFNGDTRFLQGCFKKICQAKDINKIERVDYIYNKYNVKPNSLVDAIREYDLFMHLINKYGVIVEPWITLSALMYGCFEVVKYAVPFHVNCVETDHLFRSGMRDPRIFKLLLDTGYNFNKNVLKFIISQSNLEILELVKDKLQRVKYPGLNRYLEVAQWLYKHGIPPSERIYAEALASKSSAMQKWIESVRPGIRPYNRQLVESALICDNLELLATCKPHVLKDCHLPRSIEGCQWVLDAGGSLSQRIFEHSLHEDNGILTEYLLEQGFQPKGFVVYRAITYKRWNFLKQHCGAFWKNRPSIFAEHADLATVKEFITCKEDLPVDITSFVTHSSYEVIEYLLSLGYQPTRKDKLKAKSLCKYRILDLLDNYNFTR